MTHSFSLVGRRGLVTGASRGIGWGIAQALAAAGASITVNGRTEGDVRARVQELTDRGQSARHAVFDATDIAAAAEAMERARPIDILVINAATVMHGPSLEVSAVDWQRVVNTDLSTPFFLAQAALRQMVPRRSGRIIVVSSIFDRLARGQVAAYVASKGGVSALVRALAVEFGGAGVTVNAIAPGYVETDATRHIHDDPEFHAMVCRRTPLGRWAQPDDIGGAAVFLASDAAAYVNGSVLTVDGGLTASI
jgi:gluconate 5-dehydrogenase